MTSEKKINELIAEELEEANLKFPPFASKHEAYAVIKEEYEETISELDQFEECLDDFWWTTKGNMPFPGRDRECMRRRTVAAIQELIQVAAMIDKVGQSGLE